VARLRPFAPVRPPPPDTETTEAQSTQWKQNGSSTSCAACETRLAAWINGKIADGTPDEVLPDPLVVKRVIGG
jgi:hypothetical protein